MRYGLLPRDVVFTVYHPEHVEEVKALFKVFYYAKDFATFYNMAVWARFHVNPSLYAYTLCIAVIHRPDTKFIRIPPIFEMNPHFFFNNEAIQAAYRFKLGDASMYFPDDVYIYM